MTRTLVIDTATAACSVALIEDGSVVACRHDLVGRGHAERLVPMIADLPDGGRADRILVDCGPGSFTGVRVGLAAARGLALGWGVPATGYSSMALVAAVALIGGTDEEIAVALEGGHGELFVQCFDRDGRALSPLASLTPAAAVAAIGERRIAGTAGRWLDGLVATDRLAETFPDAAAARLLRPEAAALPPVPIYGRAPDAKVPAPRVTVA